MAFESRACRLLHYLSFTRCELDLLRPASNRHLARPSEWQGSNLRPRGPQPRALPLRHIPRWCHLSSFTSWVICTSDTVRVELNLIGQLAALQLPGSDSSTHSHLKEGYPPLQCVVFRRSAPAVL